MKKVKQPPGTLASAEGSKSKWQTNSNVSPNTPKPDTGLAPTGRITLTPLKYGGQYWGWLARCGGKVCWGTSKDHARWRMKTALKLMRE